MEHIKFEDYINVYSDIISQDWVTLYEHGNKSINRIKNGIAIAGWYRVLAIILSGILTVKSHRHKVLMVI